MAVVVLGLTRNARDEHELCHFHGVGLCVFNGYLARKGASQRSSKPAVQFVGTDYFECFA